jgi:phage replication O-like protein O
MANPQKENGHLALANEIVDAMCKLHLTSYQFRILFCIIRKTYGWQKKTDHISYSQFIELSGLPDVRHVGRTINELKTRNLITVQKNGHGNTFSFQKDYELWDKPLPKLATSEMATSEMATSEMATSRISETLPEMAISPLPKLAYTKDNINTLIQKTIGVDPKNDKNKSVKTYKGWPNVRT